MHSEDLSMLRDAHIYIGIVPPHFTDRLQSLDISVNKAVKEYLRRQFQEWYANQITYQLEQDVDAKITPVDLCLSVVKLLSLKWKVGVCDYLRSQPSIIVNGFKEVGITSPY